MVSHVVGEPACSDGGPGPVRHHTRARRGSARECRPERTAFHLQAERVAQIEVPHDASEHERRLRDRGADVNRRNRVHLELAEGIRDERRVRWHNAHGELARLTGGCAGQFDHVGPGLGQQPVHHARALPRQRAVRAPGQDRGGRRGRAIERQHDAKWCWRFLAR